MSCNKCKSTQRKCRWRSNASDISKPQECFYSTTVVLPEDIMCNNQKYLAYKIVREFRKQRRDLNDIKQILISIIKMCDEDDDVKHKDHGDVKEREKGGNHKVIKKHKNETDKNHESPKNSRQRKISKDIDLNEVIKMLMKYEKKMNENAAAKNVEDSTSSKSEPVDLIDLQNPSPKSVLSKIISDEFNNESQRKSMEKRKTLSKHKQTSSSTITPETIHRKSMEKRKTLSKHKQTTSSTITPDTIHKKSVDTRKSSMKENRIKSEKLRKKSMSKDESLKSDLESRNARKSRERNSYSSKQKVKSSNVISELEDSDATSKTDITENASTQFVNNDGRNKYEKKMVDAEIQKKEYANSAVQVDTLRSDANFSEDLSFTKQKRAYKERDSNHYDRESIDSTFEFDRNLSKSNGFKMSLEKCHAQKDDDLSSTNSIAADLNISESEEAVDETLENKQFNSKSNSTKSILFIYSNLNPLHSSNSKLQKMKFIQYIDVQTDFNYPSTKAKTDIGLQTVMGFKFKCKYFVKQLKRAFRNFNNRRLRPFLKRIWNCFKGCMTRKSQINTSNSRNGARFKTKLFKEQNV